MAPILRRGRRLSSSAPLRSVPRKRSPMCPGYWSVAEDSHAEVVAPQIANPSLSYGIAWPSIETAGGTVRLAHPIGESAVVGPRTPWPWRCAVSKRIHRRVAARQVAGPASVVGIEPCSDRDELA